MNPLILDVGAATGKSHGGHKGRHRSSPVKRQAAMPLLFGARLCESQRLEMESGPGKFLVSGSLIQNAGQGFNHVGPP
jgi:hypothetical protein